MKAEKDPPALPAGCEACAAALGEMLARPDSMQDGLMVRFRPIANLVGGGIWGHLATIHGAPDKFLCMATRLFDVARRLGKCGEFFQRYVELAMVRFLANRGEGRLLLPLNDAPSELGEALAKGLSSALAKSGLPIERLIVIHDGVGALDGDALDRARRAAVAVNALGVPIGAGALACPRSEALLWQQLKPQYALIAEGMLENQDPNQLRTGRYAEIIAAAAKQGRCIIALGVDSLAMLKAMQEMPVTGVAGAFIGKPVALPTRTLSAAAHKAITEKVAGAGERPKGGSLVLEKMLQGIPPVTPETHAEEVFAMFERNPELRALAVVRGETPIGLISRYDMVDNMARPYRHELYGRKSCTRFMDTEPLIVELHLSLSELTEVVVHAHPRHLISGFIITDAGRYLGMGSVQDLVREVTAMQMEAARYANPLTQLPGNVPINQHIDNLLAAQVPCVIAYCDLDHFKPFNDVYGYARGDDVIRLTARILVAVCDPEIDFVGHIGGDDFVIVLRSEDWQARCERALNMFGAEVQGFFSRDDIERGGYVTESRKGTLEFHALTSLSIGVVEVRPGAFRSHLEVSVVAAEVKKKAKGIQGNSLYINQRAY
ncbi:MAG: diguanylate cyclase [Rhodocyclaceae bacterium]|nr:diguanylate cyclase [Rhodocyclaceae bacterium]